MNNIERAKLSADTIDMLVYPAVRGGTLGESPSDVELIDIVKYYTHHETANEFIVAVIRRDESNVFYKYLLEVLTPLDPGKFKVSVCHRLVGDVVTYLGEGLTGRLQLQLDTHNEIVANETTPDEACRRYTLMLSKVYPTVVLSHTDASRVVHKPHISMRIINKIPADMAHTYSERYCGGDRDPEVVGVIRDLDGILVEHSELYLRNILTKLDTTHSSTTSIIHGIKAVLPQHTSISELDIYLWERIIFKTLEDVRSHHNIPQHPKPDNVLNDIKVVFKGTSTFSNRDLVNMVLGYDNIETTNLVLNAISALRADHPKSYFL